MVPIGFTKVSNPETKKVHAMNALQLLRTSTLVFPLLLAGLSPAFAQTVVGSKQPGLPERGSNVPERGTLRETTPPPTVVAPAVVAPTVVEPEPRGSAIRISQLIGMEVRDASGQRLGTIQDLVATNGILRYATVGYGAATATRAYVVPFQSLVVLQGPRGSLHAQLAIESDQLRTVPSFAVDRWPDFNDAAVTAAYDRFWKRAVVGPSGDVDGLETNPERVGGTGNFGGTGSTSGPIPTSRGVGGTGNFGGTGSTAGPGPDSTVIPGKRADR